METERVGEGGGEGKISAPSVTGLLVSWLFQATNIK